MTLVDPQWSIFFQLGAVFTCLAGSHASLLLAAASVRLHLPKLMVLTALQFSVQSIFSLHFVSMCGMSFGVSWGFDVGLTLVSLVVVVLFGTPAITLVLVLRHRLEPDIDQHFGPEMGSRGLLFHAKALSFVLSRVPFLKLLLAVVLMVVAAAGCHHVGMWSIHGLHGAQITSELNFWSFLTTIALGGAVCVVAILSFLLVPQGVTAVVVAVILTGGIAAFHYSSAVYGMHYIAGVEGVTTRVVVGEEMIIMFVVAQGAISQLITAVFSHMAVQNHATMVKQLRVAQTLGKFIAEMDLQPAKAMELEAENPSTLEQTLFHIVNNLLLYRPYLPDTLFSNQDDEKNSKECDGVGEGDDALSDESSSRSDPERRRSSASTMTSAALCRLSSVSFDETPDKTPRNSSRMSISNCSDASLRPHPHPGQKDGKAPGHRKGKGGKNLAVGLRASHLTVLRIRLQGLDFQEGCKALMNIKAVEQQLTAFMTAATTVIKAHGGTIVTCTSGGVVAFWPSISPDVPLDAAIAIQQQCDLDLVQVVQSAAFLSGNLATEHMRCFNVVGPLDWAGQLMLRVGSGGRHIFLTSHEWERARFKYACLPYEQVLIDGRPATLYTVLAANKAADSKEWMYEVEGNLQATPFEAVNQCWQSYVRGDYGKAMSLARSLSGVPAWYCMHLASVAGHAAACNVKSPAKSLEALGWPEAAATGMPHEDAIILRDV